VFVYDQQTETLSRVSVASDGTEGNSYAAYPSISADGRYVTFVSDSSNLVIGDTNGSADIFVHDRQAGQTSRVSVASDGTQANSFSRFSSISADGRYVVFDSEASNLVSDDTNGYWDIFVHDRQTGQTSRVSIASDGTEGNERSWYQSYISADGRYVVFSSDATNLVNGDTNNEMDVFVHDRQTGQTSRVSVASDGTQANLLASADSISSDGRYVVFSTMANNLVSDDTNGDFDVFVHDQQTGQTSRVSIAFDGTDANGDSSDAFISADGRYVVFSSEAGNLVGNDTNDDGDVFVHDRQTAQTSRVSVAFDGTDANGDSGAASISTDGRYVTFVSWATNLVGGDTNLVQDIFVHDRGE
jgi:Tol biopolymer transport system component